MVFLKRLALALVALLLLVLLLAGGVYVRLTKGPLSVAFLNPYIEKSLAQALPDFRLKLGDAALAIDPQTSVPTIGFKDVAVTDPEGNLVAQAPRAAISVDPAAILRGRIAARRLDFIGASIAVRRNIDGKLAMGFSAPKDDNQASPQIDVPPDFESAKDVGRELSRILEKESEGVGLSDLNEIRVSNATLRFYDDANAATWFMPHIEMNLRRTIDGFSAVGQADVATSDKPWHAEMAAAWHHKEARLEMSTTLRNVIPATVARKVYALSRFASLTTPLSGRVDIAVDSSGHMSLATGELRADRGTITLPTYFAEPIEVDEGRLRIAYQPDKDTFNISNSTLTLGGRILNLSGDVKLLRGGDGKLAAFGINLGTQDATGPGKTDKDGPVATLVDHISFAGSAPVDRAELIIDDFIVLSGSAGLRMKGNITGGEKSPGVHVAGRVRDLSPDLLRVLWPPVVAPRSRSWIFANVKSGLVPEGTFEVNYAADELAKVSENQRNPPGSLDFTFALKNVAMHYYKSLPDMVGASGQGRIKDDSFSLTLDAATATQRDGATFKLNQGTMVIDDVEKAEVTAKFGLDVEAPLAAMLQLAANPDLKVIKQEDLATLPKATGTARVKLNLQTPLIDQPPKERVQLQTSITANDVNIDNLTEGIDLTNGQFNINVSQERIDINGPAKIDGLPAKINWSKPRDNTQATAQITATLDDKARERMGIKLQDYVNGPIGIVAVLSKNNTGNDVIDVKADLSSATMRLATLSWVRPPTEGTSATFKLVSSEAGRSVQNLKVDGDGLHLKGAIELTRDGKLKLVSMSEIRLNEEDVFAVRAIPGDSTIDLTITGTTLDARPYIKTVLSPAKSTGAASSSQDWTMRTHFEKVIANRGEILSNVTANMRARGGRIAEATIQGTFSNGQPVSAALVPLPTGRQMSLRTNDAGSVLRAANLYSKIAGGTLSFSALVGNEEGSPLRNGVLTIRDFAVRNEAALAELDKRGRPTGAGPRSEAVTFQLLYLPFSADDKFIRLKEGTMRGTDVCATADGVIRKSDNAIEITGTVIPACNLLRAFNGVPVIGDILSGGKYNEGIFGLTYAVGGTFNAPSVQYNPLSVLAPGVFRRLFDFSPKSTPSPQ